MLLEGEINFMDTKESIGLENVPEEELKFRWKLLAMIIEEYLGDSRIPNPVRQIKTIEAEMDRRGLEHDKIEELFDLPEPSPIVIKCNPAVLFKKTNKEFN
jgi:hypothetical protein